jgi:hypothetical protein
MPGGPPRTAQEIDRWAHGRLPHEREALPQPGERLLFRETDFGEAVPAVVDAVQDMTVPGSHWGAAGTGQPDPNVWEPDGRLKDDPWPWVAVRLVLAAADGTEMLAAPRWCKESRVRGSPGWLRAGTRAHHGRFDESGG